jgi:hypothetical protein
VANRLLARRRDLRVAIRPHRYAIASKKASAPGGTIVAQRPLSIAIRFAHARHDMHEVRLQEAARLARVFAAASDEVWSVAVRDTTGMPIVNYLFSSRAQVDAFTNQVRPLGFTRICTIAADGCTTCDFALNRRAANERLAHPARRKEDRQGR